MVLLTKQCKRNRRSRVTHTYARSHSRVYMCHQREYATWPILACLPRFIQAWHALVNSGTIFKQGFITIVHTHQPSKSRTSNDRGQADLSNLAFNGEGKRGTGLLIILLICQQVDIAFQQTHYVFSRVISSIEKKFSLTIFTYFHCSILNRTKKKERKKKTGKKN